MSRLSKMILKVLIGVIILLTILSVNSFAIHWKNYSDDDYDSVASGEVGVEGLENEALRSKYFMCAQQGQTLFQGRYDKYKSIELKSNSVEVDGIEYTDKQTVNLARALGYCAYARRGENLAGEFDHHNIESQRGLWWLIQKVENDGNYEKAKKTLGFDKMSVSDCNYEPTLLTQTNLGNILNSTENESSEYTGKFCVLNGTDSQTIFLVGKMEKRKKIELNFQKQDFNGNNLANATIEISEGENVAKIDGSTTLKSGSDGKFGAITVTPTDDTKPFKITLEETGTPAGYKGLNEKVTLTVTYNKDTGDVTKIESSNATYVPNRTSSSNVIVKNKPILNLNINKTDSLTGKKLAGVKFKIELTNVAAINNYNTTASGDKKVLTATTDKEGQIKLEGIEPNTVGTNITATITEVEVPTANGYYYKKIDPITITISYNTQNRTYSVSEGASVSKNTVTVGVKNQPYINLSGMVWNDAQTGIKNVTGPNGKKDSSETGIDGVLVQLYDIENNKIKTSTTTKDGGKYSFTDVEMTNEGYKIIFNYDGINYIETRASGSEGTDSKASEVKRTEFNNRFKTISSGQSNDGTPLTYDYMDNKSELKVNINGTNPASQDKNFRMQSQTGTYKTSTENIDCGLVKKEFDLAIRNRCKERKIRIKW